MIVYRPGEEAGLGLEINQNIGTKKKHRHLLASEKDSDPQEANGASYLEVGEKRLGTPASLPLRREAQ